MSLGMRPFQAGDLAFFKRLSLQPSVQRQTGMPAHGGEQAWNDYIDQRNNDQARILIMTHDLEPVGGVTLAVLGTVEIYQIGYFVDEAWQGRGIASLAVGLCLTSLFKGTPCARIQALVEPDNVASRRVLEKTGFEREGLLRRGAKLGDQLVDVLIYAALKP